MYTRLLLILLVAGNALGFAQTAPRQFNAGEIQLQLKRLSVLGTALYLAAHPDDENTAVIAYLANERLVRAGYLSLTRGDGGQNLIGSEQRELMGLIRTQELLQARRIDGGEQFFTRANDFGFSKSADEAIRIWGKDEVLRDVVYCIRQFRPDVIITRFPPNRQAGHGHHEASMLLALEAFDLAGRADAYPDQLATVRPWQPHRLVWNSYAPGFRNAAPDSSNAIQVELGNFNYLLGKSNLIIAAESRSMHKSQGFGSGKNHGNRVDWLTHYKGEKANTDLFDGVDISWRRVQGGEAISQQLTEIYTRFQPEKPHLSVPALLRLRGQMQALATREPHYIALKIKELEQIIAACIGWWANANALEHAVCVGDSVQVDFEFSHQSPLAVRVSSAVLMSHAKDAPETIYTLDLDAKTSQLATGKMIAPRRKIKIPAQHPLTQPFWLREPMTEGLFGVSNIRQRNAPELPLLHLHYTIEINGEKISYTTPLMYKWVKPEDEEKYRPIEITPAAMVNVGDNLLMFAEDKPEKIALSVKAGKANMLGTLRLNVPEGWRVMPSTQDFAIAMKDAEQDFVFEIFPPKKAAKGRLQAEVRLADEQDFQPARGIRRIEYAHIPIQTIFPNAEITLNRLDINLPKERKIGYIAGAGDEVPRYLQQIGFSVTLLDRKALEGDLRQYHAILVGVRAYNTEEYLKFEHEALMRYVREGGNLVVQYQTAQRLIVPQLGPFPFKIGRERVTVETAPMTALVPAHPLLTQPNKITEADFEGWVQERGLYFAESWDAAYQALFSASDPSEAPLKGGLLYAPYGKGKFVYTGIAFFRQIPAGVSGAYRLLVNLLSK